MASILSEPGSAVLEGEGLAPDEASDLLTDEMDLDWGKQLLVIGIAVSEIAMADSTLTLRFQNGATAVLEAWPADEMTSFALVPGSPDACA